MISVGRSAMISLAGQVQDLPPNRLLMPSSIKLNKLYFGYFFFTCFFGSALNSYDLLGLAWS